MNEGKEERSECTPEENANNEWGLRGDRLEEMGRDDKEIEQCPNRV